MEEVQAFAENVFVVDGPPVGAVGVMFPTRMIIVKLGDNSLWVIRQYQFPQTH